jgi:hemerythrin-like domain-containing protein
MSLNVVDLILNDHRELERVFEKLENEPDSRPTLVPVMIALLTAHSRAEEAEVYPAAAQAGSTKDVQHSQREHLEADQLAADVAAADPTADDFEDLLKKLIDAVKHHVEEEETTVLAEMRENLDPTRLAELGQAFLTSRESHLGEMPADITKDELEQQAGNVGLSGASSQTKDELKSTLEAEAEQ